MPNGLPSQTSFQVLDRKEGSTFFKVLPRTGRTHQIRVHAAWLGHSLVGDKKYFPDESIYLEYLERGFTKRVQSAVRFDRLCLHATNLRFVHPLSGKLAEIDVPMPSDMLNIWESL